MGFGHDATFAAYLTVELRRKIHALIGAQITLAFKVTERVVVSGRIELAGRPFQMPGRRRILIVISSPRCGLATLASTAFYRCPWLQRKGSSAPLQHRSLSAWPSNRFLQDTTYKTGAAQQRSSRSRDLKRDCRRPQYRLRWPAPRQKLCRKDGSINPPTHRIFEKM